MRRFLLVALAMTFAPPCVAGTRPLEEDAAVVVVVGPFVDDTGDAVTVPTIANIDITAYKNDGTAVPITPAASGTSNDMAHVADGYFSLELTATDVSTPGYLRLTFQVSGALIFHEDFEVLPVNVYDSLYGADKLQVDVSQFGGTAGTFVAGRPEVNATHWGGASVANANVRADVRQILGTAVTEGSATLASQFSGVFRNDDVAIDDANEFLTNIANLSGIKAKSDFLPSVTAGSAGGLLIAGSNGATTFATLTSTGAFSINGTNHVAQTGDSFARIGGNGALLSAVPWNSAWAAHVQSASDAALVARGLDHLLNAAVTGTDVTDNSIIARIVSKSATADWDSFANTTDSLEAIRDNAATLATPQQVWEYATRELTGGEIALTAEAIQGLLAAPVPPNNEDNTIGDALNAARANAVGKWTFDPATRLLSIYSANGTTVIKTLLIGENLAGPLNRTPQ